MYFYVGDDWNDVDDDYNDSWKFFNLFSFRIILRDRFKQIIVNLFFGFNVFSKEEENVEESQLILKMTSHFDIHLF